MQDSSRPVNVHYFSNPKSWMTSEIMEAVVTRFNRKLIFEDRKVILFLDNATCHPESMIGQFSIKKSDQNHFLTEEYNFKHTTNECWPLPKFQGQVLKEAG